MTVKKTQKVKKSKGYEHAQIKPHAAQALADEDNHWRQDVYAANDEVRYATSKLAKFQQQANEAKAKARAAKKELAEATRYLSDVVAGVAQPKLPFPHEDSDGVSEPIAEVTP